MSPAPSLDGHVVVFKNVEDTAHWAWIDLKAVTPAGRPAPQPFQLPIADGEQEEVDGPAWSPSGRHLSYTFVDVGPAPNLTGLYVAPAAAGPPHRIAAIGDAASPAWSPDGAWIAFARTAGLWPIRAEGTRLQQVRGISAGSNGDPAWLPPAP